MQPRVGSVKKLDPIQGLGPGVYNDRLDLEICRIFDGRLDEIARQHTPGREGGGANENVRFLNWVLLC